MNKKAKKIVYILGAGTSVHSGIPALCNFFQKAEDLRGGNEHGQHAPNWYPAALDSVNAFRRNLKKDRHGINIRDIEVVYDEALKHAYNTKDDSVISFLDQVILGVLDMEGCRVHHNDRQFVADPIYERFFQKHIQDNPDVAIVTLNWDCLLDYTLNFNCCTPNYGPNGSRGPRLYKLHGSINWGYCKDCKSDPRIFVPNEFVGNRPFVKKNQSLDLRLVTEGLPKNKCNTCNKPLSPRIIPPAYTKELDDTWMTQIWEHAAAVIADTRDIVFVGYSFPNTDQHFVSFIKKALAQNIHVSEVTVVNPNNDADLQKRYRDNLDADKNHLYINFMPTTFKEYVEQA